MSRLFSIILVLSPLFASSQKFDYIWVAGRNNSLNDTNYGGSIINFNDTPRTATYHYRPMNMFTFNASICDSAGNLLFYTNGCDIADADNDEILPNGDGLNPGYMHDLRCDDWNDGYGGGFPNAFILPLAEHSNSYYLFHKRSLKVTGPPGDIYNDRLLYTSIEAPDGQNFVVSNKNVDIMVDSLSFGELFAVKHSNGNDWWIITPRRNSNQFYFFLFTKDGIVDTLTQTIGDMPPLEEEGSGQTNFSPDGSKMARYFSEHDIMMFDFDRSIGQFTNYSTIHVDFGADLAFDGGCAFSPSGRFFYLAALINMYQFDLWAPDISATQTNVGHWDGFKDPIATVFTWCQLGPDCKIYSQCGDMKYYHVINNPDEPGLACDFVQRGLVLPTPSGASIPYFPNYRLGPIDNPGQPCSPVVSVSFEPERKPIQVRIFPNPANEQLTIEYGLANGLANEQNRTLSLVNVLGQKVLSVSLLDRNGKLQIPITHLAPGVYLYTLSNSTVTGKIVISRY